MHFGLKEVARTQADLRCSLSRADPRSAMQTDTFCDRIALISQTDSSKIIFSDLNYDAVSP